MSSCEMSVVSINCTKKHGWSFVYYTISDVIVTSSFFYFRKIKIHSNDYGSIIQSDALALSTWPKRSLRISWDNWPGLPILSWDSHASLKLFSGHVDKAQNWQFSLAVSNFALFGNRAVCLFDLLKTGGLAPLQAAREQWNSLEQPWQQRAAESRSRVRIRSGFQDFSFRTSQFFKLFFASLWTVWKL